MNKVSYDELKDDVRDCYHQSRTRCDMNPLQSAERTLVEFEMLIEDSRLEHLVVHLVLAKVFQEEQYFDEDFYQDLLKHSEGETLLRYKNDLTPEDQHRLVADLQNLLESRK